MASWRDRQYGEPHRDTVVDAKREVGIPHMTQRTPVAPPFATVGIIFTPMTGLAAGTRW